MSNQSDLAKSAAGFNGDPLSIDTANNRVGIGTTSPSKSLHILNASSTGSTNPSHLRIEGNNSNYYDIGRDNSGTGYLSFYGSQTSATGYIFGGVDGERLRIDSSGKLLVGTSSTFDNVSFLLAQILGGLATKINTTASTSQISFFNPNGRVGFIGTSGTTTSYNTSSDYRLKENVTDVTDGITRVKQLEPKRFNFIADPDRTVDGFLAHEAQTVVPEAVSGTHNEVDDDGNAVMQGIDQSKLVPLLTAALKESIAKIEALEARVTALEGS